MFRNRPSEVLHLHWKSRLLLGHSWGKSRMSHCYWYNFRGKFLFVYDFREQIISMCKRRVTPRKDLCHMELQHFLGQCFLLAVRLALSVCYPSLMNGRAAFPTKLMFTFSKVREDAKSMINSLNIYTYQVHGWMWPPAGTWKGSWRIPG